MNPAEEAEIIDPDIDIEIGGETVTVREIGFLEGLRLAATARPLLDDLAEQYEGDAEVGLDRLSETFGRHPEILLDLLTASCGLPRERIEQLGDRDGQLLLMTFWRVNSAFFVQRLLARRLAAEMPDPDYSAPPASSAH